MGKDDNTAMEKAPDNKRGSVKSKQEIISLFRVVLNDVPNKKWWDDASRAAKRNGLYRCKAVRGRGTKPLFYLADVARWLIEKRYLPEDKVRRVIEAAEPELLEVGHLVEEEDAPFCVVDEPV